MYINKDYKYVKHKLENRPMHLAILMTNTDESPFAQQHPRDGEKFTTLLRAVRPDWQTTVFSVKDGEFPSDISVFDGTLITGSPASVHDDAPWVAPLLGLIRAITARRQPLFGACFGHQAIALALGGTVGPNPGGWVFGLTQTTVTDRHLWMQDLPDRLHLYAAHQEQVTTLPVGARILTTNPACMVGSFAIGAHVYTTQYHPEMTPHFMSALTHELSEKLPPQVIAQARASLVRDADRAAYAESIARFYEQAR